MTFDPAIPQPNDRLSESQQDLLENFQQLNTVFGVNHVAFNDNSSNKGKHKFVTYIEQASDPTGSDQQMTVFAKDQGGDTELYAVTPTTTFQMTKDGSLYTGLIPFAAVNFNSTGVIQGTALNVSSVSLASNTYTINFTNAAVDNNYFFDIQAMANNSLPVLGQVLNGSNYNSSASTTSLKVNFRDGGGNFVTIVRASVIVWRFQ